MNIPAEYKSAMIKAGKRRYPGTLQKWKIKADSLVIFTKGSDPFHWSMNWAKEGIDFFLVANFNTGKLVVTSHYRRRMDF